MITRGIYTFGILILLFICSFNGLEAQVNDTIAGRKLAEARISKGDLFQPEEFQIDLTESKINADIYGRLTSDHLKKTIDLGKEFYTSKIHYLNNDNQIIIFFEVRDDDGSYNDVYCLDIRTLKTLWKTNLWSFNLTVGQLEQDILYLGAGENAYALNIKTGKIVWQANGLYFIHGFNSFDTITIDDNKINLTGKSKGDIVRTAVLNKEDGNIESIK